MHCHECDLLLVKDFIGVHNVHQIVCAVLNCITNCCCCFLAGVMLAQRPRWYTLWPDLAEAASIAGLLHAGGVLRDALLKQQTASHVRDVYAPKARGGQLILQVKQQGRWSFCS